MPRGATRDTIRRHNLAAVLQRVHRHGPQSRSTLTQLTGLNRSTVGGLVAELEALGLVEEVEPAPTGTAGRPSPLVRPSTGHLAAIGVDIASTDLRVAVGGLGGAVWHRAGVVIDNDARSYADVVDHVVALVAEALPAVGDRVVAGVGVAAPGVVRSVDGLVHVAPNVGWREVPLGADLARALVAVLPGGPPVVVANEAHLGARAEHLRGAGAGVDDLVYLSSEIGVGGGAIVGGALHLGADGYSGELGHLPISAGPDAPPCRCGSRGCLEAETGALALLRLLRRDPDGQLSAAVAAVLADAEAGDAEVRAALSEIGARLGRGVAGLVNVLNPRRVVLGGWFADAFPWLEPGLEEALGARALPPHLGGATVLPAALREASAVVGAIEVALEPLLLDPAGGAAPGPR